MMYDRDHTGEYLPTMRTLYHAIYEAKMPMAMNMDPCECQAPESPVKLRQISRERTTAFIRVTNESKCT
jgi:hypothetical protein